MTNFQLNYFIVAAQTLNFTTAAEQLYMTQPALSRQIAALENELGASLFKRSHNVIELTAAGQHLYNRALIVYDEIQAMIKEVRDIGAGVDGRLRIGLKEDQALSPILTNAIHALLDQRPNVLVDIERYNYEELLRRLNQGSIDIAQSSLYQGLAQGPYKSLQLSVDSMYLAYNPKYITVTQTYLRDNHEISQALGKFPVVLPASSTYPEIVRKNLPLLSALNVRYVDTASSISLYLTTGLAATITNEGSLIAADESISLIPLGVESVIQGMIWSNSNTNPVLSKLIEYLEEFH